MEINKAIILSRFKWKNKNNWEDENVNLEEKINSSAWIFLVFIYFQTWYIKLKEF